MMIPKSESSNMLYSFRSDFIDNQSVYLKVFYDHSAKHYNMEETIQYNKEALYHQYHKLYCRDYILPIQTVHLHNDGITFLIPQYEIRLNDYLKQKGKLVEEEVMEISGNILKGVYGLLKADYIHCNIRVEHFVRLEGKWKLQSIIYSNLYTHNGNQYLASPEHRMPQQYFAIKPRTIKHYREKLVWDFGCLIIQLLTGQHILNNLKTIKLFQNQPFSFRKVKADVGKTLSKEIKEILGRMCHYNKKDRMKISELLGSGFFSKSVAKDFLKHQQNFQNTELSESSEELVIKRQENKPTVSIDPDRRKNNESNNIKVLVELKNYLGRGGILLEAYRKIKQVLSRSKDEQKIEKTKILTRYCLCFMKAMDLHVLTRAVSSKSKLYFLDITPQQQLYFYQSGDYREFERLIIRNRLAADKELIEVRQQILQNQAYLEDQNKQIKDFISMMKATDSTYPMIKEPYRYIIKRSLKLISDWKNLQKINEKWGKQAIYIVYCLSIDKLYQPGNRTNNFGFMFEWAVSVKQIKPQLFYVSAHLFNEYVESTDNKELIKQASQILLRNFRY